MSREVNGAAALAGRSRELRALGAVFDEATPGLVLAGPAGVGKSRLVDEAARLAQEHGWEVVHLRGSQSASAMPFGAAAPLLPEDTDRVAGSMAAQLAAAMAGLQRRRASAPGVLLAVDDAHLLDDGSAALVLHVVSSRRFTVVVSIRSSEPAPAAVVALWKDDLLPRHDLEPLDLEATAAMAESWLGGVLDGTAAHHLFAASGGNPLYVREAVLGAQHSGALVHRHGAWRLEGRLGAGARLSELIRVRLDELSDEVRGALAMVAVGEPVPVEWLETTGHAADLATLDRLGLVAAQADGPELRIRLAHPLYGEVLRTNLAVFDHEAACRSLVEAATTNRLPPGHDARRVALWQVAARLPFDPAIVFRLAREARIAGDLPTAFRLGEAALRGGGGARAAHLLGEMLDYIGRNAEAEALLSRVSGEAEDERAYLAMARADNLYWGLARHDEAIALTEDVERSLTQARWRDSLRAQRAKLLGFGRRWDEALAVALPLLEHPEARVRADAALPVVQALTWSGRPAEAAQVARTAVTLRRTLVDELQITSTEVHVVTASMAMVEAGSIGEAVDVARQEYAAAIASVSAGAAVWFALQRGRAELVAGRVDDAIRFAAEAAAGFGPVNVNGARWSLVALALAAAHGGRTARARDALDQIAALAATPVAFLDLELGLAEAWTAVSGGDLDAARRRLVELAGEAAGVPQPTLEATAWFDLARLGDPSGLARLRVLGDTVDGDLMPARLAAVQALAAADSDGLACAGERFAALGAHLWAAEWATFAAETYEAAGRLQEAVAARQRAAELAARCPGAATPALRPLPAAGASLTKREREVAELAAAGFASRQIGERLGVSPRTVETHLQKAYGKLGVTGRRELGAALRAQPAAGDQSTGGP